MTYLNTVNLRMFGEGGAEGGSAESTTQGNSNGDNSTVVYGKQDIGSNATVQNNSESNAHDSNRTTSDALEERRKAYDDFIAQNKDFYTEDTQKIINRRFKQTKELEAKVNSYQAVIDSLSARYGTQDATALLEKLDNDSAYLEEAADEAGMTVEQYKQFRKLERENKALLDERRAQDNEAKVQAQVKAWTEEADSVKNVFPQFDLDAELQNPEFVRLIQSNIPMEHAYKLLHYDELMSNMVIAAATSTEKRTVDNIRAKGNRPLENGTRSTGAFTVKDDVSKLTKEDRAEIAKRVRRGERISF